MEVITGKIVDKVMINDKMITTFLLLLNIHSIILMQLLNMEIVCPVCNNPFTLHPHESFFLDFYRIKLNLSEIELKLI